ncbi:hypothetical protein CDO26_25490 (plasmid) [Sinorhizobium meliloti]|nr:hypothetical protein CDO26_25490 [Sinorhizobium meliloti]ASP93635.1 hypothetical protein CDO25_21135 [Sinorhizobium meliloti]
MRAEFHMRYAGPGAPVKQQTEEHGLVCGGTCRWEAARMHSLNVDDLLVITALFVLTWLAF